MYGDQLTQDPWHASQVRSTHQTTPTHQRPAADLSTPAGGSTVARMLAKPLGAHGMDQPAMPMPFPGADTMKERQGKQGSWWENREDNAVTDQL